MLTAQSYRCSGTIARLHIHGEQIIALGQCADRLTDAWSLGGRTVPHAEDVVAVSRDGVAVSSTHVDSPPSGVARNCPTTRRDLVECGGVSFETGVDDVAGHLLNQGFTFRFLSQRDG